VGATYPRIEAPHQTEIQRHTKINGNFWQSKKAERWPKALKKAIMWLRMLVS
jgi:hypothetical protein